MLNPETVPFHGLKTRMLEILPSNHPARIILDCLESDESARDGASMWIFCNIMADELINALSQYQASTQAQAAAKARNMPVNDITPQDIAITYDHFSLLSTIATLIDNRKTTAAQFLIEHHGIDPESAMIKAALSQLANQKQAEAIKTYAAKLQKV